MTAAWSATACGRSADRPRTARTAATDSDDVTLVVAAIDDEETLESLCLSATQAHPSLARLLDPVRQRQRQHVRALREALTEADPEPSRATPRAPATSQAALAAIRRAATQASGRRGDDCLTAESGPLARLMGSISASHAVSAESMTPRP